MSLSQKKNYKRISLDEVPQDTIASQVVVSDRKPLLVKEKGGKLSYGSLSSDSASSGIYSTSKKGQSTIGIFSYATGLDYWLLVLGTLASVIHGAGFPLLSIVLGGMTTVFLRAQNSDLAVVGHNPLEPSSGNAFNGTVGVESISREEFKENVSLYSLYYLLLGVAMLVTSYIQIACWESMAERIVHSLRQNYMKAMLRQEIAWFDKVQTGNLTARLTDDLERVREGVGDKASLFIQQLAAFVAGFAVGFFYNWQMTLVMVIFTPFLAITNAWAGKVAATRTQVEQEKYAVAGAIADETFSSIRTVQAMNGQRQEIERYERALEEGRKTGLLKYMYMGISLGLTYIITHASYAVAFWFASRLVIWDPSFDRGSVFTVFFAVMNGSTALGTALPYLTSMGSAQGAARHVLKVINNKPKIDPYSNQGLVLNSKVRGSIAFNNVHFSYPLRKDIKVLDGVSFSVEPGQKIALVGSSGCGKSTTVNLVMRFYDSDQGSITLDGHDLSQLNVRSLRDCIGVVSQEPVLFDGTLEENIMLGNEFATREDVNRCCKMANAYDFIQKLSDGLYTRVGERGAQLSGGQKQRIAIARALIRNPKILLLDEATSALDTESEKIVQEALDKAQEGRTTIIVAHRLATIKNVDQILVFKEGKIVERGTHDDLYNQRGLYHEMVNVQQIHQQQENTLGDIQEDEDNEEHDDVFEDTYGDSQSIKSTSTRHRKPSHAFARSISRSSRKRKSTAASLHSEVDTDAHEIKELQEEMEEHELKPSPISKIFNWNKGTWHFLFFGLMGCILSGLVMPFFAVVYAQIFAVFSEPVEQLKSDAIFWAGMFLVIGFLNAFGFFVSANMLGRCGEALTKRLRLEAFVNLLRQDIGFYDDKRHNTGKLCTRFATDAPNVRYVFTRLPVVISSLVTLIGAIVIGFVNGWKLALVLLLIVPLIIASGYFEMQQRFGKQLRDTELLEEAGKVASEAVENIRTVQGLNKQTIFYKKYSEHLASPFKANMRQAHIYALVFAFSQSLMFFMYALAFWIGSMFVLDGSMSPVSVFRVFFAIAFCGQSVGQLSSFIPDEVKGNISLQHVNFSYPTRKNISVLTGLNLDVEEGETVALVGYSGCGKSTVISLLERFYNPDDGYITIDGVHIRDFNIHRLRDQMCLVSQEPTLFDCTIKENICYGLDDSSNGKRTIGYEEIVRAAEQANIHNFILGLPEGYDTRVGERGTQLSGGQKQRIAIARALIRNPSILLLDEATSALDSESEKIVQDALDKAKQGRTCIVIAHRLSTVQNADKIAVINEGRVVEIGSHQELLARGGIYKSLCATQILGSTESASVE
ncbi:ABC transporter transmembrane region domain-containing protein [Ditylenchus destructor]|uniref:ABC transporter transmembrane region domain-containing protein n=1 Tax=Ditylenchus destructor TaxID=166010 RepID=A0AAD4N0A3_9BILA|nr:ABC transporter transmembrane region domain-containing protein [Ditylenchus destructor]